MKKQLTLILMLITATIFTSCKKEDYSNGEYYKIQYQTVDTTLHIIMQSSQPIHNEPKFSDDRGSILSSVYTQNGEKEMEIWVEIKRSKVVMTMTKNDGSMFTVKMQASSSIQHTTR